MEIIDGKALSQKVKDEVKAEVEKLTAKGLREPMLACIIIEGNSASEIYVANKQKACKACGIESVVVRLKNDVSQEDLLKQIDKLNRNKEVSGILLQLPLPKHLNEDEAINRIDRHKDVDCLTRENLGAMFSSHQTIVPCTASGIIRMLKENKIDIVGKRAVVVGRSLLVGRSVAALLMQENATVTVCHRHTQNLDKVTKEADILVVAIGNAKFITKKFIKKGAVVIDVGINRTENGICGDVDFENVKSLCKFITPVPGGVGPMTVACLMENTLILHKNYHL